MANNSFNPLAWLRLHSKWMMAGLVVVLVIGFTATLGTGVDPLVQLFTGPPSGGGGSNQLLVTWKGGNLTTGDLDQMRRHKAVTGRFMQELLSEARSVDGQAVSPGVEMIDTRTDDSSLVAMLVLAKKAEEMGVVVDDKAVEEYLRKFTDHKVGVEKFGPILSEMTGNSVTKSQVYQIIRLDLLARQMRINASVGLAGTTPAALWEMNQRLERKAKIEFSPLAVADFVKQTGEPSEGDIAKLYAEGKERPSLPFSAEPGFARLLALDFHYLEGDYEAMVSDEMKKVTDEDIAKFYETNKARFRKTEPDATVPPTTPMSPETPLTPPANPAAKPETPATPETKPETPPTPETKPETKPETPPTTPPATPPEDKKPEPEDKKPEDAKPDTPPEEKKPEEKKPDAPAPEKSDNVRRTFTTRGEIFVALADDPAEPAPAAEPKVEPKPEPATPAAEPKVEPKPEPATPAAEPKVEPKPEPATPAAEPKVEPKPEPAAPATPAVPVDPAATPAAPANPAAPMTPATPATPAPDDPTKFKPLAEVKEEIRKSIAEERSRERITKALEAALAELKAYTPVYRKWLATPSAARSQLPPTPPDVDAVAKKYGLKGGTTGLIDSPRLSLTPLGKTFDFSSRQFLTLAQAAYQIQGPADLYVPRQTYQMDFKRTFVSWIVAERKASVPELKEVRDEVIAAWKMQEAFPLAQKAAEKLAADAKATGKPLKEALPGRKVFTSKEFTWYTSPQDPRATDVESVDPEGASPLAKPEEEKVQFGGDPFMEAVFALKQGEIGVAPNVPKTFVYIVQMLEESTIPEAQYAEFLPFRQQQQLFPLAAQTNNQLMSDWYREVLKEFNVTWLGEPRGSGSDE